MYSGKVWRLLESETKGRKIKLITVDVCLHHQQCSSAVWWRWIGRRRRQHRLHSREHRVTISTQSLDICKHATPIYHRRKPRRMFGITQTFGTLCKTTTISLRISAFIQGKKILANLQSLLIYLPFCFNYTTDVSINIIIICIPPPHHQKKFN